MKLYEGGNLWDSINTTMSEIESTEVKQLVKSIDDRLLAVIEKKIIYIKMICVRNLFYCMLFQ